MTCPKCGTELEAALMQDGSGPLEPCWLEPTNGEHTDARCIEALVRQMKIARQTMELVRGCKGACERCRNNLDSALAALAKETNNA